VKRGKVKIAGITMYCLLMLSIPLLLYFEIQDWLLPGTILVVVMFALGMGMLWLSDYEDEQAAKAKHEPSARMRSMDR